LRPFKFVIAMIMTVTIMSVARVGRFALMSGDDV
jgi:hypothetical protein